MAIYLSGLLLFLLSPRVQRYAKEISSDMIVTNIIIVSNPPLNFL